MARINIKDAGKFSQVGNDFFTLKDDGDIAKVRFLYESPDGADMDFYLVHEVRYKNEQGREVRRYVSCNAVDADGHMHRDDCPLCKAGNRPQEKLFLQLYNEDEDKVQIWERGKTFVGKIVSFLNRYGSLVAQPIEIERKGKKGDQGTTYELFALEKDNKTVSDFPEKQNIEGTLVIKASKQDMIDMVDGVYDFGGGREEKEEPAPRARRRAEQRHDDVRDVIAPRRVHRVDDEF